MKQHYFYVMQNTQTFVYKVGVSANLVQRRMQLSTGGNPMTLLWAWPLARAQAYEWESAVKICFAPKCVKGKEWFKFGDDDLVIIHSMLDRHLNQKVNTLLRADVWFDADGALTPGHSERCRAEVKKFGR
jgi:predicted GIY-YIG superfamily endonuclease